MIRDSEEFRKKASMYNHWRNEYDRYCQLIKDLEYEESKIPSTFPETVIVKNKVIAVPIAHGDHHQKELKRLDMIDHKDELEHIRDDYKMKCIEIDDALNLLPKSFRMIVEQIYINKTKTIIKLSKEIGYSPSGLSNKIYRTLDKYLQLGEFHI